MIILYTFIKESYIDKYRSFVGGIIFMVMPFQSALVINYIIATYLVVAGLSLLIEAVSMKKI